MNAGTPRNTNSGLTQQWLAYARRIVADENHRAECAALGGSSDDPELNGVDLRWPGYLGEDYRIGGLLCVANIHRGFLSGGLAGDRALVDDTVASTRGWRDRQVDDDDWLFAVRAMYAKGLANGGWDVARHFAFAYESLGERATSIAYSNTARCQHPTAAPKRLLAICLKRFPLTDLVRLLGPRLVLTSSPVAFEHLCGSCPLVYFHQRYGTLLGYSGIDQHEPADERLGYGAYRASWTRVLVERGFAAGNEG